MKHNPQKANSVIEAYLELTKPRITYLILVSTALGYYLATEGVLDIINLIICLIGSCLVSSGAGVLNQYAEIESDSLMDRTRFRPLPAGIIPAENAKVFGIVLILVGIFILFFFINKLTATLAILTVLMYLFIYTPLKKITWLNTSIGAIPGALPPLGGWTAATDELHSEAWILFGILYLWQHPHFYAIALMYKNDYSKAGYKMLPVLENESSRTNRQIIWHLILLIPLSLIPSYIGLLGSIYFYGAFLLGVLYFLSGFPLIKTYNMKNARLLLKVSVIYLPALFCLIIFDKLL